MRKRKILEVSDFHNVGGAAIAAGRISSSLKQRNIEVDRISSDSSDPDTTLFLGRKTQLLRDLLVLMNLSSLGTRVARKETNRQFHLLIKRHAPDSILIHNIHGVGWPMDLVAIAASHAPTTWTLHDCWSFSGTYYPSHAPKPSMRMSNELNNFWKRTNLNRVKCHPFSAVSPSRWMHDRAQESFWKEYSVEAIHNPIPDSYFRERDRRSCKKSLGLNEDDPVVLCIAGNLNEERKGGSILQEIIRSTPNDKTQYLLVGDGSFYSSADSDQVKSLGFLRDEITLQIAYSASDLLLHPAPIDNLPNTVAESMSCGTPVLAFETGGLPEMVIPKKSGWLVKTLQAESMINVLSNILLSHDYETLRESCRATAKDLFDQSEIAERYEDHLLGRAFNNDLGSSKNRSTI
jgi:glycosyltransferase involved in cell wall biosynthesis